MGKPAKASGKVLPFAVSRLAAEEHLERWIRGIVQSNSEIENALERLRDSYKATLTGKPFIDADEILMAVETALGSVEKTRNLI
jgi:hypothetical protein